MRTFQRISRLIRPAIGFPLLAALALAGMLVLALGCGQDREPTASTASSGMPRLADVPVPADFKFKADRSGEKIRGGFRVVEHLYEGGEPVRRVAEFYRQMMPPLGWVLKEQTFNAGTQRFAFEKGNDNCFVSIYDDWGTKLLIQVYPKGARALPEPPATPGAGGPVSQ